MRDLTCTPRSNPIALAAATAGIALLGCLACWGLAAPQAEAAGKPRVVKAVASADGAGAIASATATCPAGGGRRGAWRALSGGFAVGTYTPQPGGGPNTPVIPFGSSVVYEFRRIGSRSWRVSAQVLWGRVTLHALANCQRGVPKPRAFTQKVATPGLDQLGPSLTTQCPSGRAVSGGFETPLPFAAGEARNRVIDLFPTGTRAWRLRVVSNEPSAVTSIAYCAERRRKPKLLSRVTDPGFATRTLADTVANSAVGSCSAGAFAPGGGGFRQPAASASDYFVPLSLNQSPGFDSDPRTPRKGYVGNDWHLSGLKVGSGAPVTLQTTALCG